MAHIIENIRRIPALCMLIAFAAQLGAEENQSVTDDTVRDILDRGLPGVFYAWSPHMPLSVDGLSEILAAGERLDLLVIPVLSSHANIEYARSRIVARNLPESILRRGQSTELVGRDLFVHAPAILIFDNSEFVSPVLPGFRYAADYEALIERYLNSTVSDP